MPGHDFIRRASALRGGAGAKRAVRSSFASPQPLLAPMALPRFFVDVPLAVGEPAVLPRAVTRHALRALRLQQGELLTLFNGRGGEYVAQLVAAGEPEAAVQVVR